MKLGRRAGSLGFALLLSACAVERVELFPDDAASSPPDTGIHADAATIQDDAMTLHDDATADPDAAEPDTGEPDSGGPADSGSPDASSQCVCRFVRCTLTGECQRAISATSTCSGGVCTGDIGGCQSDVDCANGTTCVAQPTSIDPC